MTLAPSAPKGARSPRFRRRKQPPAFELTARDLAIVNVVARFRFLSAPQITRLVGGSHQQVLRRLKFLFDAAYLEPQWWVCRPDLPSDACRGELATTVLLADGPRAGKAEPFA